MGCSGVQQDVDNSVGSVDRVVETGTSQLTAQRTRQVLDKLPPSLSGVYDLTFNGCDRLRNRCIPALTMPKLSPVDQLERDCTVEIGRAEGYVQPMATLRARNARKTERGSQTRHTSRTPTFESACHPRCYIASTKSHQSVCIGRSDKKSRQEGIPNDDLAEKGISVLVR